MPERAQQKGPYTQAIDIVMDARSCYLRDNHLVFHVTNQPEKTKLAMSAIIMDAVFDCCEALGHVPQLGHTLQDRVPEIHGVSLPAGFDETKMERLRRGIAGMIHEQRLKLFHNKLAAAKETIDEKTYYRLRFDELDAAKGMLSNLSCLAHDEGKGIRQMFPKEIWESNGRHSLLVEKEFLDDLMKKEHAHFHDPLRGHGDDPGPRRR